MTNNKQMGNRFEEEMCELLAKRGWWAHNMAMNPYGQPADIIAVKRGRAYLIDCKLCSGDSFIIDRIEENQRYAMELWYDCGNGVGLFAIKIHETIYITSIDGLLGCGKKLVDEDWLRQYGCTLNEWLKWVELCTR